MRTFAQKQNHPQKPVSSSLARPNMATFGPHHPEHPILHAQGTIGNQTVLRMFQTHAEEPDVGLTAAVSPRFGYDFSQIPIHPPAAGAIQTKLAISKSGDKYEQEADRVADQVMRMRRPLIPSHQGAFSNTEDSIHALIGNSSSSEKALEPEDRQFFESRFNHNFADVRVHTDREANEAARGLQARAYTVGNNMNFAPGEYRPCTTEGRHLLSHELAHVIQHRSISRPDIMLIQRQPQENKPKQTPQPPPKKPKTLDASGVGVDDPVYTKTAQIIDEVLQRNQKLAPYIGDKLKSGFRIAEKGKFVQETRDPIFDDSYRNAYNLDSAENVPSSILGFYDYKKSVVHLRPDAKFGTALHESVHRLASPGLYSLYLLTAEQVSENLFDVLKEGITAYFTDSVLKDEELPNYIDAYSREKKKAETLVTKLGFDLVAKFYFQGKGIVEIGNKLGLSQKQFGDLKGGAIKEILKRMNDLL